LKLNLKLIIGLMIVSLGVSGCKTSPAELSSDPASITVTATIRSAEATEHEVVDDKLDAIISTADKSVPVINEVVAQEIEAGEFNLYPRETNGWDESGWSIITPADDSRLIYVSNSTGDDAIAEFYAPSDVNDVGIPGNIRPFKTIEMALSKAREGFPDWVLLRQGDTWVVDDVLKLKRGRSTSARAVISSYGSSGERPIIKSTASEAIRLWDGVNFVVIKGISLYASHRDPNSSEFVGWGSVPDIVGIRVYKNSEVSGMSILLEDLAINYFSYGMSIDGGGDIVDVVIRRNIITNSYSEIGHSQGIYAGKASVLLEENVFYHNGWYKQQEGSGNEEAEGQATMFNHNTYFPKSQDTIFRKNIFIDASSIHNKWTADAKSEDGFDSIQSKNIVIENNVYIGGEIGISAGGNTDYNTGFRWQNITISNNIMFSIGRDRPTNRTLGWYIDASDWDGGMICGNYLLHNNNSSVTNLKGIEVSGHSSDVLVQNNLIIGLINGSTHPNAAALLLTGDEFENIRVERNVIQMDESLLRPVRANSLVGIDFDQNRYFSQAEADNWFRVDSTDYSMEDWELISGETGAMSGQLEVVNPIRSIESYASSVGYTLEQFKTEILGQSRSLWSQEFTAEAITEYIKTSYGIYSCD